MDEEMADAREAVRSTIKRWGGQAVMWEELTPRDQHAERAYTEGVERSSIFVLLVGRSYGAADETGYSPTHKEGRRAKELSVPRLVFEDDRITPSERDGRLNDWLRSLHAEVSTGGYQDPNDLSRLLENRLREIAAGQETTWIKLGNLVFPGTVSRHHQATKAEFIVRARVGEGTVRRAVSEIVTWSSRVHADRLTWSVQTHPVAVDAVSTETVISSEDEVEIRCSKPLQPSTSHPMLMTVNGLGPSDQAEMWVRQAVFGEPAPNGASNQRFMSTMVDPDPPYLPEVLSSQHARGWVAEGLTRLYVVEGLLYRFGGEFDRLEVGPATAGGIRVSLRFTPDYHGAQSIRAEGVVPFGQ